jgi:hypothetical protein
MARAPKRPKQLDMFPELTKRRPVATNAAVVSSAASTRTKRSAGAASGGGQPLPSLRGPRRPRIHCIEPFAKPLSR